MQATVSMAAPIQSSPPFDGGGLVQVRVRFRVPCPHVTLQGVSVQLVHLPSTAERKEILHHSKAEEPQTLCDAIF